MKTKNISINTNGKKQNKDEKLFLEFKFLISGEDDIIDDIKLTIDTKNGILKYVYYSDDLKEKEPVRLELKDTLKNNISILKKIKNLINNSLDFYIKDLSDISKQNDLVLKNAIDEYIKARNLMER